MKITAMYNDRVLYITGELSQRRGNEKPYFSITGEIPRVMSGCCHNKILIARPDLKDFADLHLSDIDGIPVYAIENGWYWIRLSLGLEFWNEFQGYTSNFTMDECFVHFCNHLRIDEKTGRDLQDQIIKAIALTPGIKEGIAAGKKVIAGFVESQKPRYKQEAENVIRKYGLTVINHG